LLGTLTEIAATIDVDPNYTYNNFSTLYIMLGSIVIMAPIISKLIDVLIAPKFKKPLIEESEMGVSKKGLMFSTIAFVVMILVLTYMITPGIRTMFPAWKICKRVITDWAQGFTICVWKHSSETVRIIASR